MAVELSNGDVTATGRVTGAKVKVNTTSDLEIGNSTLAVELGNKITNPSGGSTGNVLKKTATGVEWGDGGSNSYASLLNKPSIDNHPIVAGDQTAASLGLVTLNPGEGVTQEIGGTVKISTLNAGSLVVDGTRVRVVNTMPISPTTDTLYFIKEIDS